VIRNVRNVSHSVEHMPGDVVATAWVKWEVTAPFDANLIGHTAAKNIKLDNPCLSYNRKYRGPYFEPQCQLIA